MIARDALNLFDQMFEKLLFLYFVADKVNS